SYLWSWHWAHSTDRPIMPVPKVFTLSMLYVTLYSSGIIPPSSVYLWLRKKAVASISSLLALGNKSPAICQVRNLLYGIFSLKECMTQSRQGHCVLILSSW